MRLPVWVIGVHAAILAMAACLLVLDRALPPDMGRGTEMSVVVTDSGGRALRVFPVEDGRWRLAADIDRIDPAFIAALIEVEDQRFYDHAGVDPLAVVRAAFTSARAGRVVSGASTLTMQTARLLEPRPRNLGSKVVESWRALQLERRLPKDEILELYLSLTPYGGNLEGIRAASWAYFGREPERLTAEQIAWAQEKGLAPEGDSDQLTGMFMGSVSIIAGGAEFERIKQRRAFGSEALDQYIDLVLRTILPGCQPGAAN